MKQGRKNSIDGEGYGTIYSFGCVVGFFCGVGEGIGKSIGRSCKALARVSTKILPGFSSRPKQPAQKEQSFAVREQIRSVVIEELARFQGNDAKVAVPNLEQRLQVMAETILALQERLDELGSRGDISETDMLEAMDSLKTADALTNDERAVLVNVFRQNIALQKPELVVSYSN